MVLIDGKLANDGEVKPDKHTFIGTFREPQPPSPTAERPWQVYICPCGQDLFTREGTFDHWRKGHMDLPQYRTIENGKEN